MIQRNAEAIARFLEPAPQPAVAAR